jgi:hypothetical protein
MENKKGKHHDRGESKLSFEFAFLDIDRASLRVGVGILALGVMMAIIALLMAPVSARILLILINRGAYVRDQVEIEFFDEHKYEDGSFSDHRFDGRVVSSGEQFTTRRTNLVRIAELRDMAAQERIPGHRSRVWYLPRRGVWSWIDRVAEFRILAPEEFERPPALDMGFLAFNIVFAVGGAFLFRRGSRRVLKEIRKKEWV